MLFALEGTCFTILDWDETTVGLEAGAGFGVLSSMFARVFYKIS